MKRFDKAEWERWWENTVKAREALFGLMVRQIKVTTLTAGTPWSKQDSMASLLQSRFIMRHSRKAVKTAASFMSRSSGAEDKPDCDRERFNKFDTDGTGQLELKEMQSLMEELGFDASAQFCSSIVDKFDANGDGTIGFEEFKEVYAGLDMLGSEDML